MLVIRTGKPGHGKTLNSIKEIDAKALAQSRIVYYHNINGLKPEMLKASWFEFEDPEKWYELPENSIIVIDEAQGWFGARDPRARPDEHITKFETMRHSGFEVHLITQDPRYLDVHLRRLANVHIHFWRVMKGNQLLRFESEVVIERVELLASFKDADKTRVRIDKRFFDVYTSSNADHHFKFQPSKKLILSIIVLIVTAFLVFRVYQRVSSSSQAPETVQETSKIEQAISKGIPGLISSNVNPDEDDETITPEKYMQLRTPRVKNIPWSAPIYDELTEPVAYPKYNCLSTEAPDLVAKRPVQTVRDGVSCQCYTQQVTPMDVDFDFCMDVVKNGIFDPAKPDPEVGRDGRGRGGDVVQQARLDDPRLPPTRFVTERDKFADSGRVYAPTAPPAR